MQRNRGPKRQNFARWIAAVILSVVAALLARYQNSGPTSHRQEQVPLPGGVIEGVADIIDGDSLYVDRAEFRMKGIDAPEGRQTCSRDGKTWSCGEEARRELQRLIGGTRVRCQSHEQDQHGRHLGICSAHGQDLNAAMVANGYALAYGGYTVEEMKARAQKKGLWSGEFQRPRDWRRDHGISR